MSLRALRVGAPFPQPVADPHNLPDAAANNIIHRQYAALIGYVNLPLVRESIPGFAILTGVLLQTKPATGTPNIFASIPSLVDRGFNNDQRRADVHAMLPVAGLVESVFALSSSRKEHTGNYPTKIIASGVVFPLFQQAHLEDLYQRIAILRNRSNSASEMAALQQPPLTTS